VAYHRGRITKHENGFISGTPAIDGEIATDMVQRLLDKSEHLELLGLKQRWLGGGEVFDDDSACLFRFFYRRRLVWSYSEPWSRWVHLQNVFVCRRVFSGLAMLGMDCLVCLVLRGHRGVAVVLVRMLMLNERGVGGRGVALG
jgi:hypothetical protein